MSSNSIYCDRYAYHYTYLITNVENGMRYIGVRSCNRAPQNDIGKTYTSSSRDRTFKKEQKDHPERFTYEVIMVWSTRREAELHEKFLLLTPNAARSPIYYNRHNGGTKFDTYGKVTVKDKDGETLLVSIDDPRYLSGELIHVTKGKVVVKDKDGNTMQVSKDDPRFLSGELVGHTKGKVPVIDKDNNTMSVSVDDPKYKSGELVHTVTGKCKGTFCAKDPSGKVSRISNKDPRFLSGELSSIFKDTFPVKDKNGKVSRISNKDPRFLSGELTSIFKDNITAKDNNGNFIRVSINDPRLLSKELVPISKGTIWINNGLKNKRIENWENVPKGWERGMVWTKDK